MAQHEYLVVPAPARPAKFNGLSRKDDAFALTLAQIMNDHGREGWSYVRTDRLTQREGRWPFGRRARERELLVFSRAVAPVIRRPAKVETDPSKIRARRVRETDLVDFVRSGGRKIAPDTTPTAAE